MKGHNYKGICNKCGKSHKHPRGMLGKKHSQYTKEKYYKNRKGWNKGKTRTNQTREKMRIAKLKNPSRFWQGKKRLPFSKEWRKNIGLSNKKRGKWVGQNNPMFINGLTKPYLSKKHNLSYFEWKSLKDKILERDGKRCGICGETNKVLCLHHIIPYRISLDNSEENLQLICRHCHPKKDIPLLHNGK